MKFIKDFINYINEERLSDLYFNSNRIDNMGDHKFEFIDYNKSTNILTFDVDEKYTIDIRLLDDTVTEYRDIFNSDVKVHCSCNDFRYVFAYWANQNGYGIKKELRPSDIRNPYPGSGTVCKHITALATKIDDFEDEINDAFNTPDIDKIYREIATKHVKLPKDLYTPHKPSKSKPTKKYNKKDWLNDLNKSKPKTKDDSEFNFDDTDFNF